METEMNHKLSFPDVEIKRKQSKFIIKIYRNPTFTGVYSNFESFLLSVYKFGRAWALIYMYFCICSTWTQFHTELTFPQGKFRKNAYPENFIDKCLKKLLNNIHLVKENLLTRQKVFGSISSILRNDIFANSN